MQKYTYKTKPFEHQRTALIQGAEKKLFGYFMEMGTGKTKVCIDNMTYLYQTKKINLVLVIAPNSVYFNWKTEIQTHCPEDVYVHTYKKDKKFEFKKDQLNFFLINVEAFSHSSGVKIVKQLTDQFCETMAIVIDESTTIKNRSAKRTKNIIQLSTKVPYKRILTGSPITKSPLDLYSQCGFLCPSLLGFTNFYVFRARYSIMKTIQVGGNKNLMIPLYYTNLDELENKIKGFTYRVKKEDCLDLPAKIYQKRLINLSKQQQENYDELKQYARTIIEDEEASYNNKLTEIIKLQQVCNGFITTDEGEIKELSNAKLTELLNILEEIDGKVIIWANYIYNIEQIINTLKKKYGERSTVAIYGAVSVEARNSAVINFQENKNVKFFVGNPTTGGYGLNLTQANYVVYFSNSYNLEVRQQSEDRAHRIGQTKNVTYIDIVANKTIDEFILKVLNNKLKISAQTLGEEVSQFL
tara:strand:+ start:9053 stop:10459 length:1407 start_codon:yes stop_codon:yes gene_type:complete